MSYFFNGLFQNVRFSFRPALNTIKIVYRVILKGKQWQGRGTSLRFILSFQDYINKRKKKKLNKDAAMIEKKYTL